MAREFKNAEAALRVYGGLMVQRLVEGLNANNSNASGALNESIALTLKAQGAGFFVDGLDYWGAVDGGRKAGKRPPITEIEKWLTYPNVRDKMRFGASDKAFGEKEMRSLAFMIARKIGREGTKGNNFFKNVVESDLIDDMVQAVANGSLEDMLAMIDQRINDIRV
jgi:hypothetical protein